MSVRIVVDPRSGYPIYLQIVAQVQRAVAIGMLAPGEQLPTVKQLASDLLVNPSTIARAMRELEHLGVIVSHAGRGSFVSESLPLSGASTLASKTITAALSAAFREARELGVDAQSVRALIDAAFTDAYGETEASRS